MAGEVESFPRVLRCDSGLWTWPGLGGGHQHNNPNPNNPNSSKYRDSDCEEYLIQKEEANEVVILTSSPMEVIIDTNKFSYLSYIWN